MNGAIVIAYDPVHVADGAQVTVVSGNSSIAVQSTDGDVVSPSTSPVVTAPTPTTTGPPGPSGTSGAIADPECRHGGTRTVGSPGLSGEEPRLRYRLTIRVTGRRRAAVRWRTGDRFITESGSITWR